MRVHGLIAAMLLLSACGGADQEAGNGTVETADAPLEASAAAASTSDDAKMRAALASPCDFLPQDKVAAAAGTTVEKVDPLPAKGAQPVDATCLYNLNDGSASVDITYAVPNPSLFDADEIAARRDVAESTASAGKKFEDVPGIGDVAYYDPNREQLTVYRGSAEQVIFHATRRNMDNAKDITIAMAKAAGY